MTRTMMAVATAFFAACLANQADARSLQASSDCMVVTIEAEDLETFGGWSVVQDSGASGGEYITWEGDNNKDPEQGDRLATTFDIAIPGTYRFQWLMRQPEGSRKGQANDAWLFFPDALRFGHVDSNTIYQDFVKVFGRAGDGQFEYTGTATVDGVRSEIGVEFLEPGRYEMEISGRSSGFQLDQVMLFGEHLSVDDAARGCRDEDGNPVSAPTPSPITPVESQDDDESASQDDDESADSGGAPSGAIVDDIVRIIEVNGRNPGGAGWADSYSVGDRCYMYTNLDHGIADMTVDTPIGELTILELYETMDRGPGIEGRPLYNDIQCGNGPLNDVADEFDCPGLVEYGRDGCGQIGPLWDLSELEE